MYWTVTGLNETQRFRHAVALALAVHAACIFGISFTADRKDGKTPQIEVTLATRPTERAPDDANRLAQANQQGSGDEHDRHQLTTREQQPATALMEQQLPQMRQDDRDASQQDIVTTRAISTQMVNTEQADRQQQLASLDGISPEVDRLNRELASLQAELDRQTAAHSEQPRVRRLTAASAKAAADAAYLLDWRRRLEAVGNKYYPEASIRYGIYGELRLLVAIRHDGTLEDVRVLSSSGYAVLDEAAIKIVRMAAPYAPFSPELRKTTDKLEIVRTWQFQQNALSSN